MTTPCSLRASASAQATTLRETAAAIKNLLDTKQGFIDSLDKGEAVTLPAQIPFTTFQKLEKNADPEFMEAAIDYAEAYRGVKDLVKLAKLTKQPVEVSSKEAGKPRTTEVKEYGEVGSLASTKSYAERALQEVLGASLALDAAIAELP